MEREPVSGTQSVERAFGLLHAFTDGRPELRVTELSRLSGLGQSTVSRLLSTLEGLGYVERDAHSGLYRLGRELVRLAGTALNQSAVHREGRMTAQSLAHELGLGANIAERRGAELFYLLHFEGRLAPRSYTLTGRTGPLHATAIGKAMIHEYSRHDLEQLLSVTQFPRYTPHTVTDLDALMRQLNEVRDRGYADEVEELAFGRGCVAAPIRDRSGTVVAALSVSGPLSALALPDREAELASRVIESADQVSIGLGYLMASSSVGAAP